MIFISRLHLDHYLHPWNCDIKFLDKDHRINENPEPAYFFVCFLFSLHSIFFSSVQPVTPKATFETHRSFMVFTVSRRSHLKFSACVCFMQDLDMRARPGLQCSGDVSGNLMTHMPGLLSKTAANPAAEANSILGDCKV